MSERTLLDLVRQRAGTTSEPLSSPTFDPDLIPEAEVHAKSPEAQQLDEVLNRLDILEAYSRWCGKMTPEVGTRRESIMISCPMPGHADTNPSAWINLDKQVWHCGACGTGGDKYDIAALGLGFPVPGYKKKTEFIALRHKMAEELGVVLMKTPTGKTVPIEPTPATVTSLPVAVDAYAETVMPSINWRAIITPGTFLHDYLTATSQFDLPDEYHFWCGMQMIGTAVGKTVHLESVPDIYPNFFVCLLGPSGIGKSRAARMAMAVIREALPFDHTDPHTAGTHLTPMPGSGESLLDIFSMPEVDPSDPKKIMGYRPVRGLVSFNEMSSLAQKANRVGNTLKPALIDLYDGASISQKSRSAGHIVVENPFCQVIATTQPRSIRDVLASSDADSGFVNRWVFAVGPPRKLTAYYTERFNPEPLVKPLQQLRAWSGTGHRMKLTGEALSTWQNFFYTEIEPIKNDSDDLPLLTRCDLTLMKIIIALAINDKESQPTVEHVRAALTLWPYLKATYGMLAAEIGIGETDACAELIIENIKRHTATFSKGPTVNDLFNKYLKKRFNMKTILEALRQLEALDQIVEIVPVKGTAGRPAVRYAVNT